MDKWKALSQKSYHGSAQMKTFLGVSCVQDITPMQICMVHYCNLILSLACDPLLFHLFWFLVVCLL